MRSEELVRHRGVCDDEHMTRYYLVRLLHNTTRSYRSFAGLLTHVVAVIANAEQLDRRNCSSLTLEFSIINVQDSEHRHALTLLK